MMGPTAPALARASVAHVANAVCLFLRGSSQSKNGAYLPLFDSPPMPTIDKDLQYDRYSEAVRRLRPLFPLACTFLEPDDVNVAGDVPIDAGGSANILEVTIDGCSFIQKTYRCYESYNFECIFKVRITTPTHHIVHVLFQRYLGEVWVCTHLSHPNVVQFVGVDPTTKHPFTLLLDTAGHLDLKEYLRRNPNSDRLKLVRCSTLDSDLPYIHSRR